MSISTWPAVKRNMMLLVVLSGFELCPDSGDYTVEDAASEEAAASGEAEAEATPLPAPRLGHIMTELEGTNADGSLNVKLYVQGANVDEGAKIIVDGTEHSSTMHRALELTSTLDRSTLKYPIYFYNNIYASITATSGEEYTISVKNTDGQTSNEKNWLVPEPADWDTDGDALLDSWERSGFDGDGDGTFDTDRDCNLPAMGADYKRYDIFVQADYMNVPNGDGSGTWITTEPTPDMWPMLEGWFATAPLISLSDVDGIHVHIDHGQDTYKNTAGTDVTIPPVERLGGQPTEYSPYIRFDDDPVEFLAEEVTVVNFYNIKTDFFDIARRGLIFHYAVFAEMNGHERDGTGKGEFTGNDFFISLDQAQLMMPGNVTGVFMHELGHNLGLKHGGDDEELQEPNHQSVMSTYSSYFIGGVDTDCDGEPNGVYDFSLGMLKDLDEGDLDESVGICNGVWIDYNTDGIEDIDLPPMEISSISATDDGDPILDDHDNWGNIIFRFNHDD